jgi:hypothetical protein
MKRDSRYPINGPAPSSTPAAHPNHAGRGQEQRESREQTADLDQPIPPAQPLPRNEDGLTASSLSPQILRSAATGLSR